MSHFILIRDLVPSSENSDFRSVWRLALLSLALHLAALYILYGITLPLPKKSPDSIMVEMGRLPDTVQTGNVSHPKSKQNIALKSRPIPPVRTSAPLSMPTLQTTEKTESHQHEAPRENPSHNLKPVLDAAQGVPSHRQAAIANTEIPASPVRQPAPAASTPTAVDPGTARNAYHARIRELIERNKEYPVMARRGRMEGRVFVRFVVSRDGKLNNAVISTPSRHSSLNQAALGAVTSVDRFPPLPGEITGIESTFEVPITFSLSSR